MNTLESNLLITLAMVIMIVLNLLFGLFSFYMIKEHETTLQRLLNTLYLLLAFVIQVSLLNRNCLIRILRQHLMSISLLVWIFAQYHDHLQGVD